MLEVDSLALALQARHERLRRILLNVDEGDLRPLSGEMLDDGFADA